MIDPFPGNLAPNPSVPKKKMLLSALGVLAILVLPFAAVTLLWHDRCPSTAVQTVTSPDGRFIVRQITKDCGKRMPKATEVHLAEVDHGASGNEKTMLILPSEDKLPITWNSNSNVAITLPHHQSQVVTYKREWQGVHVALIGDIISSVPIEVTEQ